jgi:REP element-mobilizing transposase RayT
MPNTYSQILIHVVFCVKGRANLIDKKWRGELHRYISGTITSKGQKSIIVNGVADHVHCFIGLKPSMSLSELIRDVKNNSSKFINEKQLDKGEFQWQEGFGAFSYATSQVKNVYTYILNQEEHHKKSSFKDEYLSLLENYEVDYDEKYLFNFIE